MSGDKTATAAAFLDSYRNRFLLERLDTVIFAAFIVRLRIKLRHPAALETAVDGLLDAAEAQPLIAFVWFHVIGGDHFRHHCGIGCRRPQQMVYANRTETLFLQLLERQVLTSAGQRGAT